jgi:GT2 family glycosyltransferase
LTGAVKPWGGAYAVVCNDDVEVLEGWWPPLRDALDAGAPVVFPLTVDGAMRHDFAAWCFALSRATLAEHAVAPGEFLDPELVVWFQDTDLLDRLRAAGTPPRLVSASRVRHGLSETVGTTDPELRAWIDLRIAADKAVYDGRLVAPQARG